MRGVLVLNASFEPLSVVSARRATCLVVAEKADVVEADDGCFRSPSITVPVPLVVRLRYMVRAPPRTPSWVMVGASRMPDAWKPYLPAAS